jgi:hypothetical protein
MGTDWKRLADLQRAGKGYQFGMASLVRASGADTIGVGAAQSIRAQGDISDINPWRIYLGPRLTRSTAQVPGLVTDSITPALYPLPTPTDYFPNANPNALLSGYPDLLVFANIRWGSGGANLQAFVDWPVRGLRLQVSGNYIECDALALGTDLFDDNDSGNLLPDLTATLSDEPGGERADVAATLTYPFTQFTLSDLPIDPATELPGVNYIIPPFARAVRFFWDLTTFDTTGFPTSAIIRFRRIASVTEEDGVYVYNGTAGAIGDPRYALPVPAQAAYLRVEWPTTGSPTLAGVGVQWELDL